MDDELDRWIRRGLDAWRVEMDATFDFEGGLADVYSRATTEGEIAGPTAHPKWTDRLGATSEIVMDNLELTEADWKLLEHVPGNEWHP